MASKFHNKKCRGKDSKAEARRYSELKAMEAAGYISNLRSQVEFELIPKQYFKGKYVEAQCKYICDYCYLKNGKLVVEDVKSDFTRKLPEYVIKRKLMLHVHGIYVNEVIYGKNTSKRLNEWEIEDESRKRKTKKQKC